MSAGSAPSPEALFLDHEKQAELRRLVRDALGRAPENYRRVIERHYLDGVPIDEIAAEYYEGISSDVDGSDSAAVESAQKRARNRVDQHLTRAKQWLRQQLADALTREEP